MKEHPGREPLWQPVVIPTKGTAMWFINVEAANEHRADLRRAADRDRRHRAPRTVHPAAPVDPGGTRRRRASRWGSSVAAATRLSR